jgi:hypothetical protein
MEFADLETADLSDVGNLIRERNREIKAMQRRLRAEDRESENRMADACGPDRE